MADLDPDRLLTMSAFEAAYSLRRFRRDNPDYEDYQLIESIRAVRADFYPNDFEAGLALEAIIASDIDPSSDIAYFRAAIDALVDAFSPLWIRLAPGGREHVLQAVSVNGAQCFRNAGLLETPPSAAVSNWWDVLAGRVRGDIDARRLQQGRDAEKRSFEYEERRLQHLGIDRRPRWTAIEDNDAGYDILSYNPGLPEPTNRLIEVKSSAREPPTIFLTRMEWNKALESERAYVFHIWAPSAQMPMEMTVEDLRRHVPADNGNGVWQDVKIRIEQ